MEGRLTVLGQAKPTEGGSGELLGRTVRMSGLDDRRRELEKGEERHSLHDLEAC